MDNYSFTERASDPQRPEVYISVDIETAGPNPAQYSILSIGACLVTQPEEGFYVELQPVNKEADPVALAVSRLSLDELATTGYSPAEALTRFESWVQAHVPETSRAVFVAFNAAFDWMFVNDYFLRYLGRNPFGHNALDIKAFYMGMAGVPWSHTSMRFLGPKYLGGRGLKHNALSDAKDQADLFRQLLTEWASRTGSGVAKEGE